MRWNGLFDDLEAQLSAFEVAERATEIDERTRGAIGELTWLDRLRGSLDAPVRLRVAGLGATDGSGLTFEGRVSRVGPDWVLLTGEFGRETVVAAAAVTGVRGLGRYAAVPDPDAGSARVAARLGLRHALRGIARDRSMVRLFLAGGVTVDATLDRVGADFVEVATHAAGELRRRADVRDTEVLPLTGLLAVQRSV